MTSAPSAPTAKVVLVAVYPVKDRPGDRLRSCFVEPEGLQGDRPKKHPVHIVGSEETPDTTRANIFLNVPGEDLPGLVGRTLAIGDECVVRVTRIPSGCPGVYAEPVRFGVVAVGHPVFLVD